MLEILLGICIVLMVANLLYLCKKLKTPDIKNKYVLDIKGIEYYGQMLLVEHHYKYALPYEAVDNLFINCKFNGEDIGNYLIRTTKLSVEEIEEYQKKNGQPNLQ